MPPKKRNPKEKRKDVADSTKQRKLKKKTNKITDTESSSSEEADESAEDDSINDSTHISSNDSSWNLSKEDIASECCKKEPDMTTKSSSCLCLAIFFVVLAFLFLIQDSNITFLPWMDEVHRTRLSLYKEEINEVKRFFPSQHPRLWKIIRLDMEKNLGLADPHQPSILLLASDEGGYATAQCLASKLSQAFSQSCQRHIVVDGSSLSGLTPDAAKLRIDDEITRGFKQGACSVVVSHFEEIPSFATNVFYQFCENDNAPFRNVSIIFNVQVQPIGDHRSYSSLSKYPAKWDKVLDDFLTRSLQNRDPKRMTQDMIGGLLSRITPSVVWVEKEKTSLC